MGKEKEGFEEPEMKLTVMCLVSSIARENENGIVRILEERYRLSVKQRTELDLTGLESRALSEAYARLVNEERMAVEEVGPEVMNVVEEVDSSTRQSSFSNQTPNIACNTGSSATSSPHAQGVASKEEWRVQRHVKRLTEKEQANVKKRQARLVKLADQVMRALNNRSTKEGVIALSLFGVNAVGILSKAFTDDVELREMAGITDNDEPDEEQESEGGPNGEYYDSEDSERTAAEEETKFVDESKEAEIEDESKRSVGENKEYSSKEKDRKPEAPSLPKKKNKYLRVPPVKKDAVQLEDLMAFMFPSTQQHPLSTGRMLVFGEYGPLDDKGDLRTGMKGEHNVNKHEIETIIRQIDLDDLLYIYVGNSFLTPDEKIEVAKQADPRMRGAKQLNKQQVMALFEDLVPDAQGYLNFVDVQRVIFKFRKDRIKRWKQMAVNSVRTAKPSKLDIEKNIKHQKAFHMASKLVLKRAPKIDDNEVFLMTTALLNRHSFEICNMEDKNSPELNKNVRILRNSESKAVKYGAVPWRQIT